MRILVIDDEPLVGDVIAEALRLEDHDVVVASSGEEGLRVIAQNPPDAVFLRLGDEEGELKGPAGKV